MLIITLIIRISSSELNFFPTGNRDNPAAWNWKSLSCWKARNPTRFDECIVEDAGLVQKQVTAYIALGSNLGDRRDYLDRALQALQEHPNIEVTQVSSYQETAPVGGPAGQPDFLNAAAELKTDLSPRELLSVLLQVEQALGRVRRERHGPRTIDLDLLLYEDQVIQESGLTVPHPAMHERGFVLKPLAEIAPRVVHPLLDATIQDLLESLGPEAPQGLAGEEMTLETPITKMNPTVADTTGARRRTIPLIAKDAPMRELTGLRALVTGATKGIGQAIAAELSKAGADIIIHGRRAEAAQKLAHQLQEGGVRSQIVLADLSEMEECNRFVEHAWRAWHGLDIWINNAGADILTGEAARWTFERKLNELLAVDLTATIRLSREIGKLMKAQGHGVLLNMGWDQAETGMEGDSGQLFGAVKGAVMAFTKSLALTLAPEVRVNCLAPGWIRTTWGTNASTQWQERVQRETLLGRWGTPEDVAAAARWLVSPAASFITGQIIRVNGGAVR
jgi:2-amino-4-hydroxy-6-hydroxymethyldihydropteridine diphosphokinase